MSSADSIDQYLLPALIDGNANTAVLIVTAAAIIYDSMLTASEEYEFMWKREMSAVKILFYVNKACGLAYVSTSVIFARYNSCDMILTSWNIIYTGWMISVIMLSTVWAVFSALRLYAVAPMLRHKLSLAFGAGSLAMASPVANIWAIVVTVRDPYILSLGPLCTMPVWNGPMISSEIALGAVHGCGILSDMLVIYSTWHGTYRGGFGGFEAQTRLSTRLWQDGTVFFLMSMLMNVTILGCSYIGVSIDIPFLLYAFQCIVIPRFYLNLRNVVYNPEGSIELQMTPTLAEVRERPSYNDGFRRAPTTLEMDGDTDYDADAIIEISHALDIEALRLEHGTGAM